MTNMLRKISEEQSNSQLPINVFMIKSRKVKVLYNGNFKTLKRETEEDIRKIKKKIFSMLVDWRKN